MNQTLIEALIGAAGAILGAIAALIVQSRRLPSDIKLAEAQAEKTQHEAASMVIKELRDEIDRFKAKVVEFEIRLTKAEARATESESRLADSESRANEFRRAVIALGERLDKERAKYRDMAANLVGIIEHLLDCIEHPEKSKNIDRPAIARLTQAILNDYPAEKLVRM